MSSDIIGVCPCGGEVQQRVESDAHGNVKMGYKCLATECGSALDRCVVCNEFPRQIVITTLQFEPTHNGPDSGMEYITTCPTCNPEEVSVYSEPHEITREMRPQL